MVQDVEYQEEDALRWIQRQQDRMMDEVPPASLTLSLHRLRLAACPE